MKIVKQLLWILGLSAAATSCIGEDYAKCFNPNVALSFSYTLNVEAQELIAEQVKSIDVFVFSQSGLCVEHQRVEDRTFNPEYTMLLELAGGVYDIVAWANLDPLDYQLKGNAADAPFLVNKSFQKEALIHLITHENVAARNLADLFHGITTQLKIEPETKIMTRRQIKLTKDVNTINIELKHLENVEGGEVKLALEGHNGDMYFDNALVTGLPKLIYLPHTSTGLTQFSFEVMRLRTGLPLVLSALNPQTGKPELEEDLTALILKTGDVQSDEDFDRIEVYNIVITFGINVEATITINGWEVKNPDAPLG